jgi:hypothetical protein
MLQLLILLASYHPVAHPFSLLELHGSSFSWPFPCTTVTQDIQSASYNLVILFSVASHCTTVISPASQLSKPSDLLGRSFH